MKRSRLVSTLFAALAIPRVAAAQTVATVDPHVKVTVQKSPPKIRLEWQALADATSLRVRRRAGATGNYAANQWTIVGDSLPSGTTSFEDTNVTPGALYEYHVQRSGTVSTGQAWVLSGIEVPFVDDQGVVVVVSDDSLTASAALAVDRYAADVTAEGWDVERVTIAKTAPPPVLRTELQALRVKHGARLRAAILLGGVPRAFSGVLYPDGHQDHDGAWPADGYYADLDGTWSDTQANAGVGKFKNVPGDGKFDPSYFPTDLDIAVGRVDTENMPAFAPLTPSDLLVRYLDANHAFRTGAKTYAARTWVTDSFGFFGGEAFARIAYRDGMAIVGKDPESGKPFFDALEEPAGYLLAFGSGAGTPKSAKGIGTTTDFVTRTPNAVVMGLFGSYFGDWSYDDNLLRAALVSPSPALATFWFGRPQHHVHALGALRTIGEAFLATANDGGRSYTGGHQGVHEALLGDPTLRLFSTSPPSGLAATALPGEVRLAWTPSADAVVGYHVYRREKSASSPWTRLTAMPVTSTTYTDKATPPLHESNYRVVAVKLRTTPSGMFFEHSAGELVSAAALAIPTVPKADGGRPAPAPTPSGPSGDTTADSSAVEGPASSGDDGAGCAATGGRSSGGIVVLFIISAVVGAAVRRRVSRRSVTCRG